MKGKKKLETKLGKDGSASIQITPDGYIEVTGRVDVIEVAEQIAKATKGFDLDDKGVELLKKYYGRI